MKYHAILLSDKLRTILKFASKYDDQEKSSTELAKIIIEAKPMEFSYSYRASDGQIRIGYITPTKVEKYISFLKDIALCH
jgi:hypothetical protein